jgi:tRNA(Ile2) C34 agmatinyltransferase TiaS
MRQDKLTAICNRCGETVKEFFSAVRGLGWNCIHCGYRNADQVNSIAQRDEPTYQDGTPVQWIGVK